MSIAYLGSVTVAGLMPGVANDFATLKAAVTDAFATISAGLESLSSAQASIRSAGVADLEAQLSAAVGAQASLAANIVDPTAYLRGLLSALVQVQANVNALVPSIALQGQLQASISAQAGIQAKISAFDLALSVIAQISARISAALSIAFPSLPTSPGVYVFDYEGPLSGLGAALDAAVGADTGLSPGDQIKAPVIVVAGTNSAAIAALRTLILTT